MLSRTHLPPSGFIEPCLPSPAEHPPSGPGWIHEIKHDGFRLMARRDTDGVWLLTRNGHDWSGRFPLIAEATGALQVRSCLIDGEAVACDGDGLPSFDRLRYRRQDAAVFLFAFDLLELNGQDLRREPIESRKRELGKLLRWSAQIGLQLNEHIAKPGDVVFRHACKMGLEGIVSKRLGSRYRSGRSKDWLKMKNPAAAAVKREAEEDWGRGVGDEADVEDADAAPMLGPLLCSCFLAICTNPLKVQREACTSATNTTLAVLSGTGLNEAADAAVERSLEVDARAPGGARGVAGVARCHPPVKTQFQ